MTDYTLSAFGDEAGNSCEEQIAALQQAGLSYIDIRGMDGHNIAALPLEAARAAKEKLDAANIQVAMFGSPIGKIDIADDLESDLEKLRHLGELAPVLGCSAVRVFSYYNAQGRSHDEWQNESLNRLKQLRDEASRLGLVLYHENERHIFGDLRADVGIIAGELRDGPDGVFRLIFDFDNYNQSGEDVWQNWLALRDMTDAIHLKDSRDNQHTPVGQGTGRVREILEDAARRNWRGPMSIEPHLQHSAAIMATGPSGTANQQFANMTQAESFSLACHAATDLLGQTGY